MDIKLYNTLTGKKQNFKPIHLNQVNMYVCGPTVYSHPHIGNARGPVIFDILADLLRRNYNLRYVRNITDLDDKIYDAAKEEETKVSVITDRYTKIYHEDILALGVRDDQIAGSRIEVAEYKNNPRDFVLWKPSTPDLPGWESPWGVGRPGWHLECSTMAKKYLGETLDIHGGGSDLIFPHHENECAQSICSHGGKAFANYWVHHGMIDFKNTKMSKSEGNLLLIRDLLNDTPGEVIRMALISTHYRKPINWSEALVEDSKRKLDRLYGAIRQVNNLREIEPSDKVLKALTDDLNTPKALSELFDIVKIINRSKDESERIEQASILVSSASLLGLLKTDADHWFRNASNQKLKISEIELMIQEREQARQTNDFARADKIRDDLLEQGVIIEDGPEGPVWRYDN